MFGFLIFSKDPLWILSWKRRCALWFFDIFKETLSPLVSWPTHGLGFRVYSCLLTVPWVLGCFANPCLGLLNSAGSVL
jgi:hypothetical protein